MAQIIRTDPKDLGFPARLPQQRAVGAVTPRDLFDENLRRQAGQNEADAAAQAQADELRNNTIALVEHTRAINPTFASLSEEVQFGSMSRIALGGPKAISNFLKQAAPTEDNPNPLDPFIIRMGGKKPVDNTFSGQLRDKIFGDGQPINDVSESVADPAASPSNVLQPPAGTPNIFGNGQLFDDDPVVSSQSISDQAVSENPGGILSDILSSGRQPIQSGLRPIFPGTIDPTESVIVDSLERFGTSTTTRSAGGRRTPTGASADSSVPAVADVGQGVVSQFNRLNNLLKKSGQGIDFVQLKDVAKVNGMSLVELLERAVKEAKDSGLEF